MVLKITLRILTGKEAPLSKTPGLAESMNINIRLVGTLNQPFKTGSYNETKFSKE